MDISAPPTAILATTWQQEVWVVIGGTVLRVSSHMSRVILAGSDTVLGLEFKPSPFYTLEQQLGETKICEGKGVATT
jgi:hypothetical protein